MKIQRSKIGRVSSLLSIFGVFFLLSLIIINPAQDALSCKSAAPELAATAGDGQVTLTWQAPSKEAGTLIRIYRGTSSGTETLLTTIDSATTYTDTGLTNGQTYYYQIAYVNVLHHHNHHHNDHHEGGHNEDGPNKGGLNVAGHNEGDHKQDCKHDHHDHYIEGPRSNEVSATPAAVPTAPEAPQSLAATAGDGQVTLTWEAPSDGGSAITNYTIYSGTSTLATVGGTVLTYTQTGLTNGQTYYYQVSANNSVGEGPKCDAVSATPAAVPTAPEAPQSLAATAGDGQVTLIWGAPASNGGVEITNYNIYSGTSKGTETLLVTVGGTVLTYKNIGLTNGQTYYYQVSANNSVGEGAKTNEVNAMPRPAPTLATVPSAPQNVQATADVRQVTLTWEAPSDGGSAITNYKIYRSTSSGAETILNTVEGTVLTYTDTGLIDGETYYYTITAVNAIGESAQSSEVSATVPGGSIIITGMFPYLLVGGIVGASVIGVVVAGKQMRKRRSRAKESNSPKLVESNSPKDA